MPQSLPRWLRILIVAGPLGGCGVVAPGGCGSLARAMPPEPPKNPHVAATVNGEAIPLAQVDAVIRRLPTGQAGPLSAAQVRRLRHEIVQDLADDRLLAQFLQKNTPAVEPAELDRHLRALQEALRRQGKTLADYLRESGQSEAEVRGAWELMIRFDRYVQSRATEAELRKYHEANRAFFDNVQVRTSHIVVRVPVGSPPGERVAARERLAKLRAEILGGQLTFAEAARRHSMCPTAPRGGDLGLLTLKDAAVEESITRAAFALQPGEVSEPVESEYGVHLVQAVARTTGTPVPFEKAVELVRDSYAADLRARLIAELRKTAVIHVTLP